jgi:hypothetical protein
MEDFCPMGLRKVMLEELRDLRITKFARMAGSFFRGNPQKQNDYRGLAISSRRVRGGATEEKRRTIGDGSLRSWNGLSRRSTGLEAISGPGRRIWRLLCANHLLGSLEIDTQSASNQVTLSLREIDV